jgi:hypothetical protein
VSISIICRITLRPCSISAADKGNISGLSRLVGLRDVFDIYIHPTFSDRHPNFSWL